LSLSFVVVILFDCCVLFCRFRCRCRCCRPFCNRPLFSKRSFLDQFRTDIDLPTIRCDSVVFAAGTDEKLTTIHREMVEIWYSEVEIRIEMAAIMREFERSIWGLKIH
jgi:hypothetical protein